MCTKTHIVGAQSGFASTRACSDIVSSMSTKKKRSVKGSKVMNSFVKIFYESGDGSVERLENKVNKFAIKRRLDIISAKPTFIRGLFKDTLMIVVVFKRKAEDNAINKEADIEEIRLVVKEKLQKLCGKTDGEVSTVGVKILRSRKYFGDYIEFNKPTLEVSDVVSAANELFGAVIEEMKGAEDETKDEK